MMKAVATHSKPGLKPQDHGAVPQQQRSKTAYQAAAGKPKLDAKKIAEDLKQRMIKAKEASKKSEQFLAKMESTGFQAEPVEFYTMEE